MKTLLLLVLFVATPAWSYEKCARDVPTAIEACNFHCERIFADDDLAWLTCSTNCGEHAVWVTANRWKPTRLNFWLRSFAVNTDKPDGLRKECIRLGGSVEDCEIFWHGNMLCDGICYTPGGDAFINPAHVCTPARLCGEDAHCQSRRPRRR